MQHLVSTMRGGTAQKVKFSCEPMSLLDALSKNRLPENIIQQKIEIVLNP